MSNLIELKVPDIGGHKGVDVIEVFIQVGQRIEVEESLLTLETDKATMDVPSAVAGIVREVLVKVGAKISEGDVIARVEAVAGEAVAAAPTTEAPAQVEPPAPAAPAAAAAPAVALEAPKQVAEISEPMNETAASHVHAGPAARSLARELGVDLQQIKGSGRKGRIVEEDVKAFVKARLTGDARAEGASASTGTGGGGALDLLPWPQVDFAKFGPVESQPRSRIKKISGANLARNWVMIPHVTQFDEADITEMEAFRKSMAEELKAEGIKLTPLAFLIKACVAALKKFPEFNASLDGDNLVLKQYFHIGFAADTPNGLVVPVIRDADQKSLSQLALESAALAKKAREGKLTPNDMQGGCFSISSLGGIGGTAFTPIINAPEVAILGVSKSSIKPVYNGHEFEPRLMLPLSLSYDHRVIDGASAARFTNFLGQALADIRRLML